MRDLIGRCFRSVVRKHPACHRESADAHTWRLNLDASIAHHRYKMYPYLQHVDTSIIEHLHTVVVVQTGVDAIHSNRIDTELLKVWQVSCAVLR